MSDEATMTPPSAAPAVVAEPIAPQHCPWCSELLPADVAEQCPHCHANLISGSDARLPGVTEVETPTATKVRLSEAPRRSKLLSWISGEVDDAEPAQAAPEANEALALPPRDVRREMLRLQLEAEGLTVGPDGSIELPVDTTPAAADAPATGATPGATDASAEIRKAS